MTIATDLESTRTACFTAYGTGNLDEALKQAMLAWLLLSMMPDSEIGNMSVLGWDRTAIQNLISELKRQGAQPPGASTATGGTGGDCGLDICNVQYMGVRGYDSYGGCCGGCG